MRENSFYAEVAAKNRRLRGAASPRSNFAGANVALPSQIETAEISPFDQDEGSHRETIVLQIANGHATENANIVLTAGKYAADFATQTIQDGAKNTTNNNAATVAVTTTCQYGVDDTVGWDDILEEIKDEGLVITGIQMGFSKDAQKNFNMTIQRRNLNGNHVNDFISFMRAYNPGQYDLKQIYVRKTLPLTKHHVVKYTILPLETVTFYMQVGAKQNSHAVVERAAIAAGNVAGL